MDVGISHFPRLDGNNNLLLVVDFVSLSSVIFGEKEEGDEKNNDAGTVVSSSLTFLLGKKVLGGKKNAETMSVEGDEVESECGQCRSIEVRSIGVPLVVRDDDGIVGRHIVASWYAVNDSITDATVTIGA